MKKIKNLDDSSIHYGIYARNLKRVFDFIISLLALVVFSPFFLLLCILVRIKLGDPVFFRQKRAGRDEVPFEMIKFRTMTDARDDQGDLLPDTERFTKFGDFLRKYSLDELPELICVLKGDMSLVGPRPLYTFYLPYYTNEEALRHAVRGGMTGLAQVNGRALCRWNDRFAYDVKYVKNITLWNDVKILWQTVFKVFKKSDIGVPSVTDEGGVHIVRRIQRPELVREIGSSFSAEFDGKSSDKYPTFLTDNTEGINAVFLSSCRSGLREILKSINDNQKRAIVPAFTCESVVEPFIEAGYEVFPYSLNEDLTVDLSCLQRLLEEIDPSVILFHRYFGFDTCVGIKELIGNRNMLTVIEDETQYMFSENRYSWSDYQIGSIRKWGPFPDGAFLKEKRAVIAQPVEEDTEFVRLELVAMMKKQEYLDKKSDSQEYMKMFADGRSYMQSQKKTFSISGVTDHVLESFDESGFCNKRRSNAAVLINGLKGYPWIDCIFKELPEGVTPFMLPILVHEGRKEFQSFLASEKVFSTIIWSCPDALQNKIGSVDKRIYNEILCIPCDQRYCEEDMERIISVVRKYDRMKRLS